ncbi:cerebral cavernous malformations protein 2 homolog [Ciona intestinalis]
MVVLVNYAMEEDARRSKRGGIFRRMFASSSSTPDARRQSSLSIGPAYPPRERRPLRSVPVVGKNYKVDPEVLAKQYVEKEIKYMGTISDVRHDFDPNNRTLLLSLLDEKRKVGQLPWDLSWKNDVILSFSAHNIKILWRDGERLIHRIPTHQLSAAGYVKDDSHVFQFFKFASEVNNEMCNLVILSCDNKEFATEICSLTQQLFQLVYTDSTMDFFDRSIQDGALTPKNHSYSTDSSSEKKDTVQLTLPLSNIQSQSEHDIQVTGATGITKSSTLPHSSAPSSIYLRDSDLHHRGNGISSPTSSSTPSSPVTTTRGTWGSGSSAGSANSHQLQLNEYIAVLKERLTPEELSLFAQHLHHFRTGGLTIKMFCEHLMEIYTEERKSLLLGMQHFIPATRDRSYFKSFLRQHNVSHHLEAEEGDEWWSKSDSRTVSENEERTTEISSNSDMNPSTPTTSEEEWTSVVSKVDFGSKDGEEYASSTLTKTNPVELLDTDTDEPSTSSKCEKQQFIFSSPKINRKVFKKKHRGKSPAAVEFGAPYPNPATVGTDDDEVCGFYGDHIGTTVCGCSTMLWHTLSYCLQLFIKLYTWDQSLTFTGYY